MSALARFPDWRERLAAWVQAERAQPFDWARRNCGLSACDAIFAMTGGDLAAPMRGGYDNEGGALRRLLRLGYRRVADYIDARLPRSERMLEGDLCAALQAPLDVLMICDGRGGAWRRAAGGLERCPLPPAPLRLAWAVGA